MTAITKVSDITANDIAEYLRIPELIESEAGYITSILGVAKEYILKYTGVEDLDEYQDFVIVVFILCQDMYDNRSRYVDNSNLNVTVETILGLHQRNLL